MLAVTLPNCSVLTTMEKPAALVLARVRGRPLAGKPDLVSLLRCRWPPGCAFTAPWVARVAAGVAAALAHLHSLGVSAWQGHPLAARGAPCDLKPTRGSQGVSVYKCNLYSKAHNS